MDFHLPTDLYAQNGVSKLSCGQDGYQQISLPCDREREWRIISVI